MADRGRRHSLKRLAFAFGGLALPAVLPACVRFTSGNGNAGNATSSGVAATALRPTAKTFHQLADQIIASIKPTCFPARRVLISEFGADSNADSTTAIAKAIDHCHSTGGGQVVIPAGIWRTGAIELKANVNLHLENDAVLSFSRNPTDYLPAVLTRWEGVELQGYSPLIYAFEQDNIAITGDGTIDGNASTAAWWPWKGAWESTSGAATPWPVDPIVNQLHTRAALFAMAENGVPVAERVFAQNYLRPPLIQLYGCRRVLIEGVTLKNSPFWLINPVLSDDVIVRGITAISNGPNSDGCNPESCNRVLIEHCVFDTGDDCIALKSGRNADGRRLNRPVQNVVIQDCEMRAGHGGVVIGSEVSGGAHHIVARRCRFDSKDLERGLRIKTNSVRGGAIHDIALLDSYIGRVQDAIVINLLYEEGDAGNFLPDIRTIHIENLKCEQAVRAFELRGLPRSLIRGLSLRNVEFKQAERGVIENTEAMQFDNVNLNGQPMIR